MHFWFSTRVSRKTFTKAKFGNSLSNTGPVARIVLLMLLVFSILSWAIIIRKFRVFRAAKHESLEFLKVFRQSKKLSEIRAFCRTLKGEPAARRSFNPAIARLRVRLR